MNNTVWSIFSQFVRPVSDHVVLSFFNIFHGKSLVLGARQYQKSGFIREFDVKIRAKGSC